MRNYLLQGLVLICLAGLSCVPWPRPARESLILLLSRAEPLVAEQHYGEALEILEQAAQIHAQNPLPLIRMGQIYIRQHRWLLAEDAFNRALARAPRQPIATAGLAEALFQQGRLDEAQRFWYETISLDPYLRGAFTGLGRIYLQLLDFPSAREAFLKQQAHNPDPEAQWYLAALDAPIDRAAALDYLQAMSTASQPSQASPLPPHAASSAAPPLEADEQNGQVLFDTSSSLEAWRGYLTKTLTSLPADAAQAAVAKSTGIALAQAGMWPLAVHALTVAREVNRGEDAETLAFLGHALAQMGRPALELFEQAGQVNPSSALPLYFQGLYLREQGALQAAEALFEEAIRLEPENAAFYAELARTKAEQADLSAAEAAYIAATEVADGDVQFQLLLAQFYSEYGHRLVEAGIPAVQAVLEEDPDNALAYTILGWMQFQSGSARDAENSLRRALELNPGLVSARYRLARSLEAQGQAPQARAEYRRVVDLDTSDVYRNRALVDLQRLLREQPSLLGRQPD